MFRSGPLRMSDRTLEDLTRQYMGSQDAGGITFAWQGGEPTLLGMEFYQRALEFQAKYQRSGLVIENTLQTNGTLLNDDWCEFFHDHKFLIGLSVDGPPSLHDVHRVHGGGGPTSKEVINAAKLLRKHKVEFNTLTVINRVNAQHPLQVYNFLRNVIGSRYMQFIPCVEPKGFALTAPNRRDIKGLPSLDGPEARPGNGGSFITEWSVDPEDYGHFLCSVFDEWIKTDVGRVFVVNFENALGQAMGMPSSSCVYAETCGTALAIEHDGDVYPCDHYVYPECKLGNIHEVPLTSMVTSNNQQSFGKAKTDALPRYCQECRFLTMCNGECPKNRFLLAPSGEPGLNYLCRGLKQFFEHSEPGLKMMAGELLAGRSAANVMKRAKVGRLNR
jgi:uncharacterized protein